MRTFILFLLLSASSVSLILGQNENTTPKLNYHGSFGLHGDFYKMEDAPAGSNLARRPAQLMRLRYSSRLQYGRWALPIDFMLSTDGRSLETTFPQGEALKDYLRDPLNRLSLTPRVGNFEALLGSQQPRLSRLTAGDLQLFGAGFRWQPGKWVFQAFHGLGQRAFEADSSRGIAASYARNYSLIQIGYGLEEKSHIRLNVVRGKDDVTSLENPEHLLPAEGLTTSLSYRMNFGKGLYFRGEGAASLFTRNLLYKGKFEVEEVPLMTVNLSSRMDGAAEAAFGRKGKNWGLELNSLYVGGGFEAMGYPFLQKDRLDMQVKGNANLFDNKLNINGSIGQRQNNVSGTQSADSRQLIGSFQLQAAISKQLNLSASYANFGFRNSQVEDSLKLEFISNSLSVNPSWQRQGERLGHFLSLAFQADQFRDLNLVNGEMRDNDSRAYSAMYRLSLKTLVFDLSGSMVNNQLPTGALNIRRIQIGASYSLRQQKVKLGTSLTASLNTYGENTPDKLFAYRLYAKVKVSQKCSLQTDFRFRNYHYGSRKSNTSFQESLIRSSLIYNF